MSKIKLVWDGRCALIAACWLIPAGSALGATPYDFESRQPVAQLHKDLLALSHEISDAQYSIHDISIHCYTQLDRNLLHVDAPIEVTLNVMAINDSIDENKNQTDTFKITADIESYQLKVIALARKTVAELDKGCVISPLYAAQSKSVNKLMDEADRQITTLRDFAARAAKQP